MADTLHVVFGNGASGGQAGEDHLAAAAEAKQQVGIDGAKGDDEVGVNQVAIESDVSAPSGGA
jgi:hypothetical protein